MRLTTQAFFRGTMWSMSTSLAAVQVAPSYGLFQVPLVAAHAELTTTPVPSRWSTVSRVLHVPETVDQWGKRSRLYVSVLVHARTVRAASCVLAVAAVGIPGWERVC